MQQKKVWLHTHCLTLQLKHAAESTVAASALPHIAANNAMAARALPHIASQEKEVPIKQTRKGHNRTPKQFCNVLTIPNSQAITCSRWSGVPLWPRNLCTAATRAFNTS